MSQLTITVILKSHKQREAHHPFLAGMRRTTGSRLSGRALRGSLSDGGEGVPRS